MNSFNYRGNKIILLSATKFSFIIPNIHTVLIVYNVITPS